MTEFGWAKREEEDELLDLANYVFSLSGRPADFRQLQPRVYARPGFSEISVVAREGGRIRGLVSAVTGTLCLGTERLKYGYIGTVCVHPYARGQGYMKRLMPLMMAGLEEQGCQMLALSGQRQRYQYFGFEDAGAHMSLKLTRHSIRLALEGSSAEEFSFVPLEEAGDDALKLAIRLHGGQRLAVIRDGKDFILALRTEGGQPLAVMLGSLPVGYLYAVGRRIPEFILTDSGMEIPAINSWLARERGEETQVSIPPCDLSLHPLLFAAADSWEITPSCMVRVLDWPAFTGALLRFRLSISGLETGEGVLGIRDEGNFRISVRGSCAEVQLTDGPADLVLDRFESVRLLSLPLPLHGRLAASHPFRDWFPLPFYFPQADMF